MHFDATLVAALGFITFLGILIYLKVPTMIGGALDNKSLAIKNELEHAKSLRMQAEELRLSYERQQDAVKAEAEDLIKQAEAHAKDIKKQAKIQLEKDIAAKTKAAEERIARAEQSAIEDVRSKASNLAVEIARNMLIQDAQKSSANDDIAKSIAEISKKLA